MIPGCRCQFSRIQPNTNLSGPSLIFPTGVYGPNTPVLSISNVDWQDHNSCFYHNHASYLPMFSGRCDSFLSCRILSLTARSEPAASPLSYL